MFLTRWLRLLVQHPLTHVRLAALVGEQLVVVEDHLDQHGADRVGDLAVTVGPGLGLPMDHFLPDRETFAGCQPVSEGPVP